MSFIDLSAVQQDVLKEIGNIGTGHATTSLSTLLNEPLNMTIPTVQIVSFNEMVNLIGGPEQIVVAVYFRVYGDAPGTVYFLLPIDEAETLVRHVSPGTTVDFSVGHEPNDYALSVLREIGNIITGSYFSALSDFMSLTMSYSIPNVTVDMVGAILTAGLTHLSNEADEAILINTKITDKGNSAIQGQFILMPDPSAFRTFFSSLGIQHE